VTGVPAYGTPPPPGPAYGPPSYGPPVSPYPPYGAYPVAQQSTNSMAVASMVLGITSLLVLLLCLLGFIPAIVGLVLGIVAFRQIKLTGSDGRGMAIAGVVTSVVTLVLTVVLVLIVVANDDDEYDYHFYYNTQGQSGQVTGDDALAGLVTT
jgi:hypothetical protein